jgi:SAM-dependent methyltransferase
MSAHPSHSTERFGDKVEHYIRYRPGYPDEIITIFQQEAGLFPEAVIADIGCGTGLSALPFLKQGHVVYGVEPNDPMRQAAERLLTVYTNFHGVKGTAEKTTLQEKSVDYLIAGQAFHWFDVPKAKQEAQRILRPRGWAVLLWNKRQTDTTPFLQAYEQLLVTYGTDYEQVRHDRLDPAKLEQFFGGPFQQRVLPNEQIFDYEGIKGRLLSSSYIPRANDPQYEPMLQDLEKIFQQHAVQGLARFLYDTEIYFGHIV